MERILTVHTDGSYRKNKDGTEDTGIGVTIHDEDHEVIYELAEHFERDNSSVNFAEYMAVARAIKFLREEEYDHAMIRTDSRLVSNQLNSVWNINSGVYMELGRGVKKIFGQMPKVSIKWTSRSVNVRADELAGMGLNKENYEYFKQSNLKNER